MNELLTIFARFVFSFRFRWRCCRTDENESRLNTSANILDLFCTYLRNDKQPRMSWDGPSSTCHAAQWDIPWHTDMDACKYHLFSNANPYKPYGQLLAFPTLDNPSTEGKPSSGAGWWLKHSYYPTQVILDRFPFIPNKYLYIYIYYIYMYVYVVLVCNRSGPACWGPLWRSWRPGRLIPLRNRFVALLKPIVGTPLNGDYSFRP